MVRARLFYTIVLLSQLIFVPVKAAPQWYKCTASASSHTGRYTFKISRQPCAVYWREIETNLKIKSCDLPEIAALKPSARDDLGVVWFNLKTGQFYDYLSGVYDRGTCVAVSRP